MAIILGLLIIGLFTTYLTYVAALHVELDWNKELLIKDGLIKELLNKAYTDASMSIVIDTKRKSITVDRTTISDYYSFWFPYKVDVKAKPYHERQTENDWGYTIGYVTRFSKDYYAIKSLLKKEKVDIVKVQKQKLGFCQPCYSYLSPDEYIPSNTEPCSLLAPDNQ
jgi:hypothetical protein